VPDIERQPSVPTDWPCAEHSFFVTAAGMRWHVQRAGRGPTIVLIHGTAGATHTWQHVFPLLMPAADVIAFDLPGHGFTSGATTAQLSLEGMAQAVNELLRTLDVTPTLGVGHSAGAAVLLQLAGYHEVAPKSVIGCNSALVPINALGQILLPVSRAVFDAAPVRAVAAALLHSGTIARTLLRSTGTRLDPVQEARYVALLRDDVRVGAVLGMMTRWDLPALQATFPTLRMPVTLVHSRNEPWVSYDALMDVTRTLPMRSVVDVTPAGHLIPDEKPRQLVDVIMSTLAALGPRTS